MNNKSKAFYGGGYVSDYSEYVNPPKEDRKKINEPRRTRSGKPSMTQPQKGSVIP